MKCDDCPLRFKCYTVNTAERPKQLVGVNFIIADCCYRCQYSRWKRDKDLTDPIMAHNIGVCGLWNVLVHQLSLCDSFTPKIRDLIAKSVLEEMEEELKLTKPTGLPRFCIMEESSRAKVAN